MNRSESIINISKSLLEFQKKVDKIKKAEINPYFKSKYASLSTILDAIDPILNECGLVVLQSPEGSDGLTTTVIHAETGEFIESNYSMRPSKDDPQGRGSCITYMRRYALSSILKLNVDEDDDGNKASQKTPEKPKKKQLTTYIVSAFVNKLECCDSFDKLQEEFFKIILDIRNNYIDNVGGEAHIIEAKNILKDKIK